MWQAPAATGVSVVPLTVQMDGVVDAKATTRLEVLVAASVDVPPPTVTAAGCVKVMVCAVLATPAVGGELESPPQPARDATARKRADSGNLNCVCVMAWVRSGWDSVATGRWRIGVAACEAARKE